MKGILVTGAGGGIGFATVQLLAQKGYGVVGMERRVDDNLKKTFADLGADLVEGDLCNPDDQNKAIDTVVSKYGTLYALVNVAGVAPRVRADLLEMTEESYDMVMDVNLRGTMFLTQKAARQMITQPWSGEGLRGAVVNISSMSAYTSSISRGEYCMSKAGVSMLTKLYADRLAGEGITVNEIRPGIIRTGMTETVTAKYDGLIEGGLLPIARWGTPEDVAKAVALLLDGQLSYTTGQSIDVDGGFHIRRL